MNAAQTGIENLDLEKLNDKDKAELRQFLANEQQRSQIQSRESPPIPKPCLGDAQGPEPLCSHGASPQSALPYRQCRGILTLLHLSLRRAPLRPPLESLAAEMCARNTQPDPDLLE